MDVGRYIATPANSTTDNCVDNENTEKAENIAEPENVAEKEGSENANISEECALNNAKRRKQEDNETLEEYDGIFKRLRSKEKLQIMHRKRGQKIQAQKKEDSPRKSKRLRSEERLQMVALKEGSENARTKEGDDENIEEIVVGGETANVVPKEGTENASAKGDDENIEEIVVGGETANVVPKEGTENASAKGDDEKIVEIAIGGETASVASKVGTENASAKGAQVTRGIDKFTSTNEDDIMKSEEEPYVPSITSVQYSRLTSNTWKEVSITRSTTPFSVFQKSMIYVYKAESYPDESSILNKVRIRLAGKELFYHGTTTDSAKSIIKEGIDLTMSNRPVDFSCGKGFYVTNDYDKAVEWSRRKARRCHSDRAVIAFKMDRIRNERHLSLAVNNDTNRKFWECIVSHFRHGKTSPDVARVLRGVKYIEGPVAMNCNLGQEEIPTPLDSGRFQQLCICDQGYANRFGHLENILCLIKVEYNY